MPRLAHFLHQMWEDYISFNPHAKVIHDAVIEKCGPVINDHIALRTFNDPRVNIAVMEKPFLEFGYEPQGSYDFPAKKLNAKHYEHCDSARPKVFISELKLEAFSPDLQQMIAKLLDQMDPQLPQQPHFPIAGRPWELSFADYEKLAAESEYAGWVAAHGFRVNHFTIDVGELREFDSLQEFNAFIKELGFEMNTSGGEIKGSPENLLEQSSTLAGEVDVEFTDGTHRIPACYYEFARRYNTPAGRRFEGFIAQSADRIFESTDRRNK